MTLIFKMIFQQDITTFRGSFSGCLLEWGGFSKDSYSFCLGHVIIRGVTTDADFKNKVADIIFERVEWLSDDVNAVQVPYHRNLPFFSDVDLGVVPKIFEGLGN